MRYTCLLVTRQIGTLTGSRQWCYIAKRNLDAAIALYQKTYPGGKSDAFDILWTPYYLNYNPHPHSVDKLALADVRLADQTAEQRAALTARMDRAGRAAGIAFNWGGKIGPNPTTRDAHRLVHRVGAADKYDGETQRELVEAIFEAYHCRAQDISERDALVDVAQRAQIDPADVQAWLQSGSDDTGDIIDREAEASKEAVTSGVPTLIIRDKYRPEGIPDVMDLMEIFIQAKEAQP